MGKWAENDMNVWYKKLKSVALRALDDRRSTTKDTSFSTSLQSDHGQGAYRMALKVLFMDGDDKESKCLREATINVDCKKDDFETLKHTVMPKMDTMLRELQEEQLCIPCNKPCKNA